MGAAELAYIQSDPVEPIREGLLASAARATVRPGPSSLAKIMTDPIWWFYLYWLPKFLDGNFNVDLSDCGSRSS